MVTKKIQLDFANRKANILDCIKDIRDAARYVGLNLYSKYDVQLQYPMPTSDGRVVVEIIIPDDIIDNFMVSKHLKGISLYLLRINPDKYKAYKIGNRLLNYTELSDFGSGPSVLTTEERLRSIYSFISLLERTDDDSLKRIKKILNIMRS